VLLDQSLCNHSLLLHQLVRSGPLMILQGGRDHRLVLSERCRCDVLSPDQEFGGPLFRFKQNLVRLILGLQQDLSLFDRPRT